MKVFVIDKNKAPGAPCSEARARRLLDSGKASVFRAMPFVIILKHVFSEEIKTQQVKVDPGYKTTGICLTSQHKSGHKAVWAMNLEHRGLQIKMNLIKRSAVRRSRRNRKTRYRKPGCLRNKHAKKKGEGRLPPSLLHRVYTTMTWLRRLQRYCAIDLVHVEKAKFDTQKMQNPEISGIEYQQGTLQGYEVREYLLEKWRRKCAYCGAENVPLEIEHILPRSRGGSSRAANLTLACKPCNKKKDAKTAEEFGFPELQKQAKQSLQAAAFMNAVRNRLTKELEMLGVTILSSFGYQTKMNRIKQGYEKEHWIDAACIGDDGANVSIESRQYLHVKCTGHGKRKMSNINASGFPVGKPKERRKKYYGFQTGDYVEAVVPRGKNKGIHRGKVMCKKRRVF